MNEKEKIFLASIKNKIKEYSIKITIRKALENANNSFVETQYNNGETEIIDSGIEKFLCTLSPYYFLHRYCYIDLPGTGIIPFSLYYFQKEILKEVQNFKKLIFLKTRQSGVSTLFSLYCLWRCLFHESESIDVVSLKQDKAQGFVNKMDATINRLPAFLHVTITTKSQKRIRFANHSTIVSEPASPRAGRSDTLSLLVLDEAAHYLSEKLVRGIVAAAQPTLTRTGGDLIIISTPNSLVGPGAYYAEQVEQLKTGGNDKTNKLVEISWYEVPDIDGIKPYKGYNNVLDKYIKKDYYNNPEIKREMNKFFEPIAENWKSNQWLKKQHDDLGDREYKQEILHNFIISGNQVFNDDILIKIKSETKDPIIKDVIGKTKLNGFWIWKKPIPGHRYIMGVDIALGTGQDTSSMEILDVENYEQVAEYKGYISTPAFSRAVRKVARYYNEAYVVIECNGIGEAVFNGVYYDENEPYNNVFKQKKIKNNVTRMTGWITEVKSRKLITNELIDWLSVDELWNELKIYSERIYNEAITWIWSGNRPDHEKGCHDDALMSLAIALYNRDKAITTSESFIITEKGDLVEYESKDNLDKPVNEKDFEFIMGDDNEQDEFKEKHGVSIEDYRWLISR